MNGEAVVIADHRPDAPVTAVTGVDSIERAQKRAEITGDLQIGNTTSEVRHRLNKLRHHPRPS